MAVRYLKMAICGLSMKLEANASMHSKAAPIRQATLLPRQRPTASLPLDLIPKVYLPRVFQSSREASSASAEDVRQSPQYDAYVWGDDRAAPAQQLAPCTLHRECQSVVEISLLGRVNFHGSLHLCQA